MLQSSHERVLVQRTGRYSESVDQEELELTRDRPSGLAWAVHGLGIVIGTWMMRACVVALHRDFAHPNLGWGALGLLWLQPLALLLALVGAVGVVTWSQSPRARLLVGLVAGIVYTMIPFLALGWNNHDC